MGRVLNRLCQQKITLVLVAPVRKRQLWYPMLLEYLVDFPILLPQRADLIIPTHPESVPEMMPRLAAWHISRDATRIRKFCKRPPELLVALWRQKSYDSLFRKWIIWCSAWSSDPVSGPISEVVNFLAHLFYQYRSLNA